MNTSLLKRYISEVLVEMQKQARVPTQLIDVDDEQDDDAIEEFSGVGAIAGYTGPLGADPSDLGRKKQQQKK